MILQLLHLLSKYWIATFLIPRGFRKTTAFPVEGWLANFGSKEGGQPNTPKRFQLIPASEKTKRHLI